MNRASRPRLNVIHQLGTRPQPPIAEADAALRAGQLAQAEQLLRQAGVVESGHADGMLLLSVALARSGRLEEAEPIWRELLRLRQHEKDVLPNLAKALQAQGRFEEAVPVLSRAVALMPQDFVWRIDLSHCLYKLGRLREARPHAEEAIRLQPHRTEGHYNLGCILEGSQAFAAAQACYERLLEIDPDSQAAMTNLLFLQHYMPEVTPEQRLQRACALGDRLAMGRAPTHPRGPRRPGPLRVGLLSADFRGHPVGWFLRGFLPHIDPRQIDLVAFDNGSPKDTYQAELRPHFSAWHHIDHLDDDPAASFLAAQELDLLVDLAGMTAGCRLGLLARRPAPVLVNWLGYFSSTGLPTIDWILADPLCLPPGEEHLYREPVWRLPHTRFCMGFPPQAPEVAPLPALRSGRVTLGSFQQLNKINDQVLALWARVLQALPQCDLRIQSTPLSRPENVERLRRQLAAAGIAPERCQLLEGTHLPGYLQAHSQVDFILDTFPYTGGTTTCEALWMGVPTLTLTSPGMLGRQGEAHLRNLGLTDWIATSEAEYMALAARHASPAGLQQLASLRSGLRDACRVSALFDHRAFAADWTQAMLGMHAHSLAMNGQVPTSG